MAVKASYDTKATRLVLQDSFYAGEGTHDVNGDDDRLRCKAGDRAADAVAHGRCLGCRQLRALAEAATRGFYPLQCRQVHLRQILPGFIG